MKKHGIVWSVLGILLLALLVRWWVEEQFALPARNYQYLAQKIKTELSRQEQDLAPLIATLKREQSTLPAAMPQASYPYFLYKNDRLTYWTSGAWVPPSEVSETPYRYVENSYGKFLVSVWTAKKGIHPWKLISYIPLYRKYGVTNDLIQSGINPTLGKKGLVSFSDPQGEKGSFVVRVAGVPLVQIKLKQGYKPSIVKPITYIDFALLILQITLFILLFAKATRWKPGFEILFILAGWAYFKVSLPWLEGITDFAAINVFDSRYYAVSWFEQSLGDLLLNTLFIVLIAFRIRIWVRHKALLRVFVQPAHTWQKQVWLVCLLMLTFWILNYPYFQLRSIYENSQISIDITSGLASGWLRVVTLGIVVLVNLATFILYHVAVRQVTKFTPTVGMFIRNLAWATLLFVGLSYVANMPFANLWWLNIVLLSLIWYFDWAQSLDRATYQRFFYIVVFFIVVAGVNAYVIVRLETAKKTDTMQTILTKKMAHSDPFAEFLLSESLTELASDPFIVARLSTPFLSKQAIINKIKLVFLNSYLSGYEQKVTLFDSRGKPIYHATDSSSIFEQLQHLNTPQNSTEYPSVFRKNDDTHLFAKHYVGYASIQKHSNVIGYVFIELIEKQFSSTTPYPSLLLDNRFVGRKQNKMGMAYYYKNVKINALGAQEFPDSLKITAPKGYVQHNTLYAVRAEGQRGMVAAYPWNTWQKAVSNFSFVWLITLFPILLVWFFIPFVRKGKFKSLSYTERIIWYLNLAFLLPLVVVTSVTFRLLVTSFEETEESANAVLVERLAAQLSESLDLYLHNNTTLDKLIERVEVLADNTQLDINVFALNGQLICTSQPGVFNKQLLPPYASYPALQQIKNRKLNHLVRNETIDALQFNNAYVGVKSSESGAVLGMVSVPFFSDNSSLEENKRQAFTTILNVFIMVLFATILLTYIAGNWLTRPLKIIREKIRGTTFSAPTEPIPLQWTDELGMLVKAYNQMLVKLEASKQVLAKSEKEKAWREAAQQVAHEIKNPLTPMKLTLQRLFSKIKQGKLVVTDLEPSLQSILQQVETLNTITSSFSEFAKMPTPMLKKVELNLLIQQAADLFKSEPLVQIKLHLCAQKVYSLVDEALFTRVLTNLLLNAKQSVRAGQAYVQVMLTSQVVGTSILVHIKDDGQGIHEAIADKVFIPKFTTKEQGSGIGLAMARHSIESMKGTLSFVSTPGNGATFTISLPVTE